MSGRIALRITKITRTMIGQSMARARRLGWLFSAFLLAAPAVALADGASALRAALQRGAAGDWAGAAAAQASAVDGVVAEMTGKDGLASRSVSMAR